MTENEQQLLTRLLIDLFLEHPTTGQNSDEQIAASARRIRSRRRRTSTAGKDQQQKEPQADQTKGENQWQ